MLKKIALVLLLLFIALSGFALWLSFRYPPAPVLPPSTTSAGSAASGTMASYDPVEVAKHSSARDCWLIVRGNVYDVTSYINHHPGGRRTITDRCGQEVTSVFAAIHSNRAWDLLADFRIGTLGTATKSPVAKVDVKVVAEKVATAFPGSDVLKVEPYGTGYHAVVVTGRTLLDVTLDKDGAVVAQQARSDEFEWFWNSNDNEATEWENSTSQ